MKKSQANSIIRSMHVVARAASGAAAIDGALLTGLRWHREDEAYLRNHDVRTAEMFHISGLLDGAKTLAQTMRLLICGQHLGLLPIQSARYLRVNDAGVVQIGAKLAESAEQYRRELASRTTT